jgi:hypothetical protein
MKSGFQLWMLKPKSSQSNGCTHIHQRRWNNLNIKNICQKPDSNCFLRKERCADGAIHAIETITTSEVYCKTLKNCTGTFKTKGVECWHPVMCSSMTMCVCIQLLTLEHWWSISTGAVWPPSLQPWPCNKQPPVVHLTEEWAGITALQQ